MSIKNPVTPAGIEPATFRSVAQHLNQCYRGPHTDSRIILKFILKTLCKKADRIHLILDMDQWRDLVITVTNLRVS